MKPIPYPTKKHYIGYFYYRARRMWAWAFMECVQEGRAYSIIKH